MTETPERPGFLEDALTRSDEVHTEAGPVEEAAPVEVPEVDAEDSTNLLDPENDDDDDLVVDDDPHPANSDELTPEAPTEAADDVS